MTKLIASSISWEDIFCGRSANGMHFMFLEVKKAEMWPQGQWWRRLDRDAIIHNLREGRVEHTLLLLDLRG